METSQRDFRRVVSHAGWHTVKASKVTLLVPAVRSSDLLPMLMNFTWTSGLDGNLGRVRWKRKWVRIGPHQALVKST